MENEEVFYYAQINEDNICMLVGKYPYKVDMENMIELESYDTNLLGCKYENGAWSVVEREETEATASDDELITAELLLNQMTILENQSNQDEVLAEILLNQISEEDKGGEENV